MISSTNQDPNFIIAYCISMRHNYFSLRNTKIWIRTHLLPRNNHRMVSGLLVISSLLVLCSSWSHITLRSSQMGKNVEMDAAISGFLNQNEYSSVSKLVEHDILSQPSTPAVRSQNLSTSEPKESILEKFPKSFRRGVFQEEYTLDTLDFLNESVPQAVLRMRKYVEKKGAIFVSVGHYRDNWCQHTINEIFTKCKYCNRVYVGIFEQIKVPPEEFECDDELCRSKSSDSPCEGPIEWRKNIRIVHAFDFQAAGPTWSRYVLSKLWRGEEYVLQIDAHMYFVKDWDEKCVQMLESLPTKKALVSHYPVSSPDQMVHSNVPWICNATFDAYLKGLFTQHSNWYDIRKHNGLPQPSPLIGAGFVFGRGKIFIDAPFDRYLNFLFHGEEFLVAARLWTRGWNFYVPKQNIVSHIYGNRNHSVFSDTPGWWKLSEKSRVRARYILGISDERPEDMSEIEYLGLGTQRTLAQWIEFSGINFTSRTITSRCFDVWDYRNNKWISKGAKYNW